MAPLKSWTKHFSQPGNVESRSIAVGNDGSIYIAGSATLGMHETTKTTNSGYDAFLVKYDSDGNRDWVKLYETTGSSSIARGVATSPDGSIYVAGTQGNSYQGFLRKYNSRGDVVWSKAVSNNQATCRALATDNSGNIYITGKQDGDLHGEVNNGGSDVYISKYNSSGERAWTKLIGSPDNDYPAWRNALAVDDSCSRHVFTTIRATPQAHRG